MEIVDNNSITYFNLTGKKGFLKFSYAPHGKIGIIFANTYITINIMVKTLPIILVIFILTMSCEKIMENNIPENYPTTYKKNSPDILLQMRASYALKNPYMTTSLNDFGFCDWHGDLLDVGTTPLQNIITQSEATDIVRNFVSNNSTETGVINSNDLDFYKVRTYTGSDGAIRWHFISSNQKIDTVEILQTKFLIYLTNNEVSLCVGNWYPEIFIPSEFNVNQTKAKADLIGKVVTHYPFESPKYNVTITEVDLIKSKIGLKVLPLENGDITELRVCWEMDIPGPVYYKVYIDVMTGNIVGQEPTAFFM
jgi:hypothetical protein